MQRAARQEREHLGRPRSWGPAPPPPQGRGGRPDRGGRGGGDRGRGGGGRGARRRPIFSKRQLMKVT
eukprot:8898546-Pyramimonas_sp.AAC.1